MPSLFISTSPGENFMVHQLSLGTSENRVFREQGIRQQSESGGGGGGRT